MTDFTKLSIGLETDVITNIRLTIVDTELEASQGNTMSYITYLPKEA